MRILFSFLKIAIKEKLEFSQDLVFDFLHYILYLLITGFMWTGVIASFGKIGEWSTFNFVMLTCFAGLYTTLNNFFSGTYLIQNNILSGSLDKYLCRPINTFWAIIGENFEPISLIEGLLTIIVTSSISVFVLKPEGIHLLTNILPAIFIFICGTISILCIKSIVALSAVWLGDVSVFQNILFFEDFQFDRYPTLFLKNPFKIIMNWIIPLGLIATYPAYVLTFNLPLKELSAILLCTLTVTAAWIILCMIVFNKAMKHYESFGG